MIGLHCHSLIPALHCPQCKSTESFPPKSYPSGIPPPEVAPRVCAACRSDRTGWAWCTVCLVAVRASNELSSDAIALVSFALRFELLRAEETFSGILPDDPMRLLVANEVVGYTQLLVLFSGGHRIVAVPRPGG